MAELMSRMMISLKTAFLLGKDKEEILRIFSFQNTVYEIRSKIVHGSKPRLPIEIDGILYNTLKDVVIESKRLLRLTLKRHIDDEISDEIKEYFKVIKLLEINGGKAVINKVFEIMDDEKTVIES